MKITHTSKFLAAVLSAGLAFALVSSAHAASPNRTTRKAGGFAPESVLAGTIVDQSGVTATSSIDRKWDEKSGTGTLNEAAITADGKVSSREANLTRNADGSITTTGTMTDYNGTTVNFTETSRRNAAGHFVTQGKITDEDGVVTPYETTESRSRANTITRTTVLSKADGTKETRVVTITPKRPTAES